MLPYTNKWLSCDPLWSQLHSPQEAKNGYISVQSKCTLTWMCSICGITFRSRLDNMCKSTGRCNTHANITRGANREHYIGDVPKPLLRPIRAGLLRNIGTDQLIALIATLEPISSQCAGAADPAGAALAITREYVESILAGNYTRVQLLDSVFWGDDADTRKDGSRYVRSPQPNKRPNDADTGDTENNAAPPAAGAAPASKRRRRLISPNPPVAAPVDNTNDTTDAAGYPQYPSRCLTFILSSYLFSCDPQ